MLFKGMPCSTYCSETELRETRERGDMIREKPRSLWKADGSLSVRFCVLYTVLWAESKTKRGKVVKYGV